MALSTVTLIAIAAVVAELAPPAFVFACLGITATVAVLALFIAASASVAVHIANSALVGNRELTVAGLRPFHASFES